MDSLFFYIFAAMVLGGALGAIASRNAVHNATWLAVSLLGVAGLFLLRKADFLFTIQIIVYVGGVLLLFLFVVMLIPVGEAFREARFRRWYLLPATLLALATVQFAWFLREWFQPPTTRPQPAASAGNTESIADILFTSGLLPFELASLLLLAALAGAVMLTRQNGNSA
jgi:NADH-quinone oxidoreductase subunit J